MEKEGSVHFVRVRVSRDSGVLPISFWPLQIPSPPFPILRRAPDRPLWFPAGLAWRGDLESGRRARPGRLIPGASQPGGQRLTAHSAGSHHSCPGAFPSCNLSLGFLTLPPMSLKPRGVSTAAVICSVWLLRNPTPRVPL